MTPTVAQARRCHTTPTPPRAVGVVCLALACLALGGEAAQSAPATQGRASWYSTEACQWNTDPTCSTATGESLYDLERQQIAFVASWDYPLNTRLRICQPPSPFNLTQRCGEVIVKDRGPAKRLVRQGRIIDLSLAAWALISDEWARTQLGIINVTVEALP
jgi:rare lipoprotein A (peptidoglycan hydrolase)